MNPLRPALPALLSLALLLPAHAAGRGARGAEHAARKAFPTMRYLALGDSYTIGEGITPAGRWPEQLAALLRARGIAIDHPEFIARTGWTAGELSAAMKEAAPRGHCALVTLLIGVNDQYRGGGTDAYRTELRALLARAVSLAEGNAGRVVALSIPDWGVTPFAAGRDARAIAAEIDAFNAVAREETRRAGARWVDVTQISRRLAATPHAVASDRLHPSAEQYAEWARAALEEARAAITAKRVP